MLFSLVALVIFCVLLGVGIVLGVVGVALTGGLVAAGVLSSSVLIGVWRGRAQAGWRALFLQCGVLAGIPSGMLCAWAATTLWQEISGTLVAVLAAGALAGALGGAVVALFFDLLATRAHAWLANRIERAKRPGLPTASGPA